MLTSLIASLTLFAAAAHAVIIPIDVGKGGIKFTPNTTTASVGDQLEFHFFNGTGNHSVVSSAFDTPCLPAANAFFSGYVQGTPGGENTFIVNVTSTDPIWFYCSLGQHCHFGMVGVVNPPTGSNISDFAAAAKSVSSASAPAATAGGVIATVSLSASATATAATTAASGSAAKTSGSSASGTGASASASATKASAAGRLADTSVVLTLGVFAAGLAVLMA